MNVIAFAIDGGNLLVGHLIHTVVMLVKGTNCPIDDKHAGLQSFT